ncbi:hypothetical protein SUGI_0704470 [Cryptomeria japonica]|nr:hypothetical protein SUGI_0704470 [Cryptomeria japonica]
MSISECPELEELPNVSKMSCLESIDIDSCERLHKITLPTTLIKLTVHRCRGLQMLAGSNNLTNLTDMFIGECHELEELPNVSEMSCLESIDIDSVERLHKITLPTTLVKLTLHKYRGSQMLAGRVDLTNITYMFIGECPELEELLNVSEMRYLQCISIDSCGRLQNVTL